MILILCYILVILTIVLQYQRHHQSRPDADRMYTLQSGETMILELEGNPSTGYQWDIVRQIGSTVNVDQPFVYHSSNGVGETMVGSGGWYTAIVRASSQMKGSTIIELSYHPSWTPPKKESTMIVRFDVI